MKKQMIDVDNFFTTIIESIKFMRKVRCLNEFKKLIDNYNAFQLLDDNWNVIMTDIEMIQTEGISTVKKIDPRMIVKKKDGKEIEDDILQTQEIRMIMER